MSDLRAHPSGRTLSCNGNFAELLQYTSHDITGRHLGDFFTGEEFTEKKMTELLSLLKTGQRTNINFRRKTKDERVVVQKGILYPVTDQSGTITEIVEMTEDVTP